jgi:UDP-GlcNAc:undecaprenyl-phosphate/decaprenyl-phosphate GlcNAc-1-phosphate transferase
MEIALATIISFFIVLLATPSYIKVAKMKHLFDVPSENRKQHKRSTPSMGGIMIFAATIFAIFICFPYQDLGFLRYLIPAIIIMFFVGIKDDIVGTSAAKKLMAHLLVAFIMVLMAEVKITSLYGLFDIRELPEWASISISVFTFIVVINSFNLIDGVDGLAGGVGFIASTAFGVWFLIAGCYDYAIVSFSLAGALLGFLRYNFNPASIFMGDSGSLFIGLILAFLAIELIEFIPTDLPTSTISISKPIFAMTVLVYPLLDTMRIFIYRLANKKSPFEADSNHIHHRILSWTKSHKKTSLIIYAFNILMITLPVILAGYNPSLVFAIVGFIAFGSLLFLLIKKQEV